MSSSARNYISDSSPCDHVSIALVTRLQRSETPFLNEFLTYYSWLGIDHFYLVNTEIENRSVIESAIDSSYRERVRLIDKHQEDSLNESQNRALPFVKETFLLHLDMDEYLYLNGMTLRQFLIAEGWDEKSMGSVECFFNWVMSPLCDQRYATSIKSILQKNYFFNSAQGKSLALTRDVKKINRHEFDFIGEKRVEKYGIGRGNCFVFHVSARGIFDILNKLLFGQYGNLKRSYDPSTEIADLLFDNDSRQLPNRFVLLAFQSRFQAYQMNVRFDFPELNHQTDISLLKAITLGGVKDCLGVDFSPDEIERIVVEKMGKYTIPDDLVLAYAKGETSLLKVLRFFEEQKVCEQKQSFLGRLFHRRR